MSTSHISRACFVLMFVSGLLIGGAAGAQTAQKAQKKADSNITLATKPAPPASGETTFTVTAKDDSGKPLTGADVTVELVMPAMGGMPEMKNTVTLKAAADPKLAAAGTYTGTGQIMMAGKWNATVDVKVAGKSVATYKTTLTAK